MRAPLLVFALVLALPSLAFAQAKEIGPGTVEFSINGSITGTTAEGEGTNTTILDVGIGAFATRQLQFGASLGVVKLGDTDALTTVAGTIELNFPNQSRIMPFVGGGVGTTFGLPEPVNAPLLLQVGGGIKALTPGNRAAFVLTPFYQRSRFSSAFGSVNVNTFGVSLGLSLFL